MTTRMTRLLAASVASLVLFSASGASAADKRTTRSHRTAVSRSQTSHSRSVPSSRARHKARRNVHKRRTAKH